MLMFKREEMSELKWSDVVIQIHSALILPHKKKKNKGKEIDDDDGGKKKRRLCRFHHLLLKLSCRLN
jgi:hypothetical protein